MKALQWILLVVVIVLLLPGGWFGYRWYRKKHPKLDPPTPTGSH